jgi:membrane protein implicated in regulation of membrane protease activity
MPEQGSPANAAGVIAVTAATGAVACGVCCVLPFALPAVALAGVGSIVALLAGALFWATALAVVAVAGAWLWVAWQSLRSRPGRQQRRST